MVYDVPKGMNLKLLSPTSSNQRTRKMKKTHLVTGIKFPLYTLICFQSIFPQYILHQGPIIKSLVGYV